ARADQRIDRWAAAVEQVDALRCDQTALRFGCQRIGVREKVGEEDDNVEDEQHSGRDQRQLVLAKAPPHELPLRRNRYAIDIGESGAFGHQDRSEDHVSAHRSSSRMRGSIQTSSTSDTSEPMTVRPLMSRMIVPARNMSSAISALYSSGPTVGR